MQNIAKPPNLPLAITGLLTVGILSIIRLVGEYFIFFLSDRLYTNLEDSLAVSLVPSGFSWEYVVFGISLGGVSGLFACITVFADRSCSTPAFAWLAILLLLPTSVAVGWLVYDLPLSLVSGIDIDVYDFHEYWYSFYGRILCGIFVSVLSLALLMRRILSDQYVHFIALVTCVLACNFFFVSDAWIMHPNIELIATTNGIVLFIQLAASYYCLVGNNLQSRDNQ